MYQDKEVIAFDGTVDGLVDALSLIQSTMSSNNRIAFVNGKDGNIISRIEISSTTLSDKSVVWDIILK